jgi:hypothetical protein
MRQGAAGDEPGVGVPHASARDTLTPPRVNAHALTRQRLERAIRHATLDTRHAIRVVSQRYVIEKDTPVCNA